MLVAMTDAAARVEAAKKALADAEAALAQAQGQSPSAVSPVRNAPLPQADVDAIRAGYAFDGDVLEIGALVNGDVVPDVQVRIPVAMLNRHALVAGATGTGKTRTLQVLAEQLSSAGVPVFAADIKGDLSGVATPGESS
jgi:uncharacterized protein